MSSKRLYFVLLASIALLTIGLLGGMYGANKLLSGAAVTLKDDRLRVAVLDQQQQDLNTAKRDIRKYQDLADISKSIVPQDKDQAQAIRQIVNLAAANQIKLSSIAFPNSTLGTGSLNLSQLTPAKDIPGVYGLQITVQSDTDSTAAIPYPRFLSFLTALEQNRRTALVNTLSIAPNPNDRTKLSFNIVLQEYIKP